MAQGISRALGLRFGKPHAVHFEACLAMLPAEIPRTRVICGTRASAAFYLELARPSGLSASPYRVPCRWSMLATLWSTMSRVHATRNSRQVRALHAFIRCAACAQAECVSTVFVAGGIHHEELGLALAPTRSGVLDGDVDSAKLSELCKCWSVSPSVCVRTFVW